MTRPAPVLLLPLALATGGMIMHTWDTYTTGPATDLIVPMTIASLCLFTLLALLIRSYPWSPWRATTTLRNGIAGVEVHCQLCNRNVIGFVGEYTLARYQQAAAAHYHLCTQRRRHRPRKEKTPA